MPIFHHFRGTTALVALLALTAPHAIAQESSGSGSEAATASGSPQSSGSGTPATSEPSQSSGSNLTDLVDDADAPATDGTNQTQGAGTTGSSQGNTPGDTNVAPGDMNIQGNMHNQTAGQTVMLDIEGFAQQIYERGFRQGYMSGVSDTRQQVMAQVRAQRMQQVQSSPSNMQEGEPAAGNETSTGTTPGSSPDQNASSAQPGTDAPTGDGSSARPGGSIIVLPPGVSPEAFVEQIMRQTQQ